jgi:hypothetical protein
MARDPRGLSQRLVCASRLDSLPRKTSASVYCGPRKPKAFNGLSRAHEPFRANHASGACSLGQVSMGLIPPNPRICPLYCSAARAAGTILCAWQVCVCGCPKGVSGAPDRARQRQRLESGRRGTGGQGKARPCKGRIRPVFSSSLFVPSLWPPSSCPRLLAPVFSLVQSPSEAPADDRPPIHSLDPHRRR